MPSGTPRTDAFIAGRDPIRLPAEVGESMELSIAIGKAIRNLMVDYADHARQLERELVAFQKWVADLQSGMYVNCVYCGHRYGPADEVPATMAEALKEHIERCPKHPMSALKRELAAAQAQLAEAKRYRERNPLGGPATMFRAIADRIEAGEDYYAVLTDYGVHIEQRARGERT